MMKASSIVNLIQGTIQGSQIPLALKPEHFIIDERKKNQLLAYCAEVGAVVDYYNLDGKRDGQWDSFLLADVSVLTSKISLYDGTKNYTNFLDLLKAIEDSNSKAEIHAFTKVFFQLGFEVVVTIDEWYKLANQNFKANTVAEYLCETISSQGSNLLAAYYRCYFILTESDPLLSNEIVNHFAQLDPIWSFNPFPNSQAHQPLSKSGFIALINEAATAGKFLFSLQTAITVRCAELFNESLLRNDVPPHIGLILTFIDLFKNQQQAINTITARHLDFYYQRILLAKEKEATPDTAYVTFQLAKDKSTLTLPKGSELLAGLYPDGQPIVFATQEDATISAAKIADYRTLIFPNVGSSIITDNFYQGSVNDYAKLNNPSWPLFDADVITPNLSIKPSTLGFAFSCADLLLRQGTRKVEITLSLTSAQADEIKGIDLTDYFELQLTSANGWYTANILAPVILSDANTLLFSFTLATADPAIIPYQEKLHAQGFTTTWPICKLSLTASGILAYPMLQKLEAESVTINTTVTGVYDFLIENDSGKLSTAIPFIPFNNPTSFGNLYIGGQEFFVKKLSYINFLISWEKLPKSFQSYYQAYNDYYIKYPSVNDPRVAYQNQVFTAIVFELAGEVWQPLTNVNDNPSSYCLFTNDAGEGNAEWPIVTNGLKTITLNGPFTYNPNLLPYTSLTNDLLEGFFCIAPQQPAQWFGSVDYPAIVSAVTLDNSAIIMHNAKLTTICNKKTKPLPNVPYVPKINGLEIEYGSEQTYMLKDSTSNCLWFYVHPFGTEAVKCDSTFLGLLPVYESASYVYLGIEAVQPNSTLTLLFCITNTIQSVDNVEDNNLTYECFTAAGWENLLIKSDGTNGFKRSGVISMYLPENITDQGGEVPSGLFWLRLGSKPYAYAMVNYVATQGLAVVRTTGTTQDVTPVKRGSITKFKTAVPEIKSIVQPENSFGGSNKQNQPEFRGATAGRLLYKQRIVTPYDIQACLLNEFPQLYKVTAIPDGYANPHATGNVGVVLIPWTNQDAENNYRPMASVDLMLDVLAFLQKIGSTAARYKVTNPDFFELTVTCFVVFSEVNQNEALTSKLNLELINFLSPWIVDNPIGMEVTETNVNSLIYAFINSRKYIDQVTSVTCSLASPNNPMNSIAQMLIVSASQHCINTVTTAEHDEDLKNGLCVGENYYIKN